MKLAIIADLLDTNAAGTKIYLQSILQELAQRPLAKEIICIHKKPNQFFAKHGLAEQIIPDKNTPLYGTYRLFFKIPQFVKNNQVKAVWEPSHFGPFNLPPGVKRVTTIHDLSPVTQSWSHPWHTALRQKLVLKRVCRQADVILTPSNFTKQQLQKYYRVSDTKIKAVHLAPQQSLLHRADFKTINSTSLQPYILCVGTIEPRKNHQLLLKAFSLVKKQLPQVRLVIAGRLGWKYQSVLKQIQQHPYKVDIVMTGHVSTQELANLYQNCLATVSASEYEGFNLPVAESLAFGKPTVVSKISVHQELYGKNVYYFEPQQANDLSRQILAAIQRPHQHTGSRFSWPKHVDKLTEIFAKLLYT